MNANNININNNRKRSDETRNILVSFVEGFADQNELLTGTPTVVEVGSTDLTITGAQLNSSDEFIRGIRVLANAGVIFSVAGGIAGNDYILSITAITNASPAQTLVMNTRFHVD